MLSSVRRYKAEILQEVGGASPAKAVGEGSLVTGCGWGLSQKSCLILSPVGAYFHLSDSPDPGVEYLCKLSPDHNQIIISDGHLPINMKQILEVKTLSTEGNKNSFFL